MILKFVQFGGGQRFHLPRLIKAAPPISKKNKETKEASYDHISSCGVVVVLYIAFDSTSESGRFSASGGRVVTPNTLCPQVRKLRKGLSLVATYESLLLQQLIICYLVV